MRVARVGVLSLTAAVTLAVPGAAMAAVGPPAGPTLTPHPPATATARPAAPFAVPTPGIRSSLNWDVCVSAHDCWGVGSYVTPLAAHNEIIHWTGTKSKLVAAPEPPGIPAQFNRELDGVGCFSATDCWAVGEYTNSSNATLNQALHYNGKKWKWVSMPQPSSGNTTGANHQSLYGVGCASSSDCWAVGYYTNNQGADLNETLHWNGKKWTKVTTPNPWGKTTGRQNIGYSVTCVSKSDCWQAGYGFDKSASYVNQVWHWNGKRWTAPAVPQPSGTGANKYAYLEGVSCPSASDCWATGAYYNHQKAYVNEALRWNGKGWKLVSTPNPGGRASGDTNYVQAVSCTSRTNCWTVGYYLAASGAYLNQGLHWNGKHWSSHKMAQPGGTLSGQQNQLIGVSCATSSSCEAVGEKDGGGPNFSNEALRWNGTSWKAN